MSTVFAVFYRKDGGQWGLFASTTKGKSPYYGKQATAQSFATWMENNGPYGINKYNGYEFKVMCISGRWYDVD